MDPDKLESQYNEQEYHQYITDVITKNATRRAQNPSYRGVDPDQPALSQKADDLRQQKAILKSDTAQAKHLPDLEAEYQASLGDEGPVQARPETELNPAGYTPDPRGPSAMARTIGPFIEAHPALKAGLDYMAMPGDYLRGALSGQPGTRVDPYEFTGANEPEMSHLQGAIRGAAGMMVDPLMAAGPLAGGVLRGLRGVRGGPSILPAREMTKVYETAESAGSRPIHGSDATGPYTLIPKDGGRYNPPIVVNEFDPEVASRTIPAATGTPDYAAPGPSVDETGRMLAVPALEAGGKTETMTAHSARTGRPLVGKVPGLSPGEYGPEEQTSLLAEPPSAMSPSSGKRILQPEEQLGMGDSILRPQVMRKPGFPDESTASAMEPVTKALQGLSKREEYKQSLRDNLAPQQDYRIKLQTSPRGSVSVTEAEKDSGLRYTKIPEAPADIPLVFPGWPSRITQSIIDNMNKVGPAGRNIGDAISGVLSNRAVLSSGDTIGTVGPLSKIAGVRGQVSRAIEGFRELTQGENAFVWGSHRYWNLSEAEIEQAWNYMYTNRRMVPASTKVREFAEKLYEGMLYGPSRAAHEANLDLYNPLTGKHEAFGAPSMFMPQIPTKPTSLAGISDTHLELLYNKQGGFESTGKSFPMWKSQLNRIMSQGGELREMKAAGSGLDEAAVTYDMASKRYKGLEVSRLLDLEALGGSPYQWAKKFGYETDPFRAAFKYNSSGYLRAEWAKAMPGIEQNMAHIAEHGGADLTEWATLAVNRAQGINTGLTETRIMRQLVKGVRDFNNATLLQLGGIGSTPQLGYALGRAPLIQSLLGTVDFVSKNNRALVEKSGALYPTLMNHMMQPEGPLATISSAAIQGYGVGLLDKWSRYYGGHVGVRYVDFLEKALLQTPGKERLHKLIDEIGGDTKAVLAAGKIPEEMKLAMIQRFANYAAGIPDARGLPLIATSETSYARLANQYRIFMFNNGAELTRLWKQAPTMSDAITRISKVILGTGTIAAGSGALTEAIRNAFTEDSEGSPFVNKRLKKLVGDEGAAFAIQTLMYGTGALYASLALTALDNGWKLAASLVGGPTAGLLQGVSEDVVDTIINGPNWKSLRTAARRTPLAGPLLAPIVQSEIESQTQAARQEQQFLKSLQQPSGFQNQP